MSKKFTLFIANAILLSSLVAACGGSAAAPSAPQVSLFNSINLGRIETVLNEDGSGYNTFWLVVPSGADCAHLGLRSRLESISRPTTPDVIEIRDFQDEQFPFPVNVDGFEVIYEFHKVAEIPVQIDAIKRAVVDTVMEAIAARPTPEPGAEEIFLPSPVIIGQYYNQNHLSFSITPSETLAGKKWDVAVVVNPFLMTGLITEEGSSGLAEPCSLSSFTYELQVSGNMKINRHDVESLSPALAEYSHVEPSASTIEWTLDSRNALDAWNKAQETELQGLTVELQNYLEKTPTPDPTQVANAYEDFQTKYVEIMNSTNNGRIYKLNLHVTTPAPWLHFLTNVLTPMLGLTSIVLGLFLSIRNLRKK